MKKYPEEVIEWLRENAPGNANYEIVELINKDPEMKKYGFIFTESTIHNLKTRNGIKSGTNPAEKRRPKYSAEIIEYIKRISPGMYKKDIAAAVSKEFGIDMTMGKLNGIMKKNKIKSGVDCRFKKGNAALNKGTKMSPEQYEKCKDTMFKKGHVPENILKVGTVVRTTKDGYFKIKTGEPNKWEFVHRYVWEKVNGKIPEGMVIVFKDGNKENVSIENLELVNRQVASYFTKNRLTSENKEIADMGIIVAKLDAKTNERKKELKNE